MEILDPQVVKNWRLFNRLRQSDVAKKLDVSTQTYHNFEAGATQTMKPATMRKLRALMETTMAGTLSAPATDSPADLFLHALCTELHVLGDWMVSPQLSGKAKADRFKNAITGYYENLDDYLAPLIQLDSTS